MPTDVRLFTGRMNDDDSVAVIPSGDYRYARNLHIAHSRSGNVARAKNVPGTTEVEYALAGTGAIVVGSLEDEQHDRVFYFVAASGGYQEILCYSRREGSIRRVMWDYFINDLDGVDGNLNFSANSLITGIGLLHPFLFWTDNNNEPRFINVDRALRTFDVSYLDDNGEEPDPYLFPLYYKDLTIIRPLPIYPPILQKLVSTNETSVVDQQSNQIKDYAFQFCYRFMYRDGLYSALSPQSLLENYNNLDNAEVYDTVRVWIPKTQNIGKEVRRVEAIHRVPGTNNYYVVKSWDRNDPADEILINGHNSLSNANPQLFFDWFNTYTGTPIPEAEAIKLFDNVPVKSKALEVADDRVFLGNNTEGYNLPSSIQLSATAINQAQGAGLTAEYYVVYVDCYAAGLAPTVVILVKIMGSGDPAVDGFYFVSNQQSFFYAFFTDSLPTTLYLSSGDRIGPTTMTDSDLLAEYSPCPTPGIDSYVLNGYAGTQPTVFGLTDDAPFTEGVRIFKSNSRYRAGIVFFDFAGRNVGVMTNQDCLVDTANRPAFAEEFTSGISWALAGGASEIPTWATQYAIVRTKNLAATLFTQFINDAPSPFATGAKATRYVLRDEEGVLSYQTTWETEVYALAYGIDNLSGLGHGYTFSEGDFLRVYANDNSGFKDFRVIGQEGVYLLVEPKNLGTLSTGNVYYQSVVEIYTPHLESANELFYEVGNMYAILNPGESDRAFSVTSGVLRGDSYIKLRHVPEDDTTLLFESMSPADSFWNIWNTDAGRPNLVIKDVAQQRRRTAIRWSNQYIAGSRVNGLCSYDAGDEKVLDERIGDIQKIVLAGKGQSEGSALLAIGKNNTASIYLGETQVVDNSTQTLLATSGQVVGTVRQLQGGYGTNHPESVVENASRVYWYDEQRRSVVRYAANGLAPISDYKLRSFFHRLAEQTDEEKVIAAFDRLRGEYLLTFDNLSADAEVTFLSDYDGEILGRGTLIVTEEPIGLDYILGAGITYTIEVSWSTAGTINLYVGATLIESTALVAEETITIEVTPSTPGVLGYSFVPDGDDGRGEYTLSVPLASPHQLWQGRDFTIAFRDIDGAEGWTSVYDYVPEWMSACGNLVVLFKDGALYTLDNTSAYNTFFGVEYPSGIAWVLNNPPNGIKLPAAIGFMSNDPPSWVHFRTETPDIQSSDNGEIDFRLREGYWYAETLRDRLSPNEIGTPLERSLKGDKLRSAFVEIYAEFRIFTTELELDTIKVLWRNSSGHF